LQIIRNIRAERQNRVGGGESTPRPAFFGPESDAEAASHIPCPPVQKTAEGFGAKKYIKL
jgi:hypothetical protein